MTDIDTHAPSDLPFDEHDPPAAPVAVPELLRKHIDQLADDGSTLDQFVALKKFKGDLDKALRQLSDHLAPREKDLLDEYAQRGTSGEKHAATGSTVYINRRVWARVARSGDKATDAEKAATAAALEAAGLGQYVEQSVAVRSLSARYNALVKQETDARKAVGDLRPVALDDVLEPAVRGFVDLTEDHILGLRSA
jgi:hypothetical protein